MDPDMMVIQIYKNRGKVTRRLRASSHPDHATGRKIGVQRARRGPAGDFHFKSRPHLQPAPEVGVGPPKPAEGKKKKKGLEIQHRLTNALLHWLTVMQSRKDGVTHSRPALRSVLKRGAAFFTPHSSSADTAIGIIAS